MTTLPKSAPFTALPRPKAPMTFIEAIATQEGFYAQDLIPNRPQRNLNPGDLEWHPWMKSWTDKADPRFAIFDSVEGGFAALRTLLEKPLYKGKTISQVINIFAPGNENDTKVYILNVCAFCEKTPDTVIDGILG